MASEQINKYIDDQQTVFIERLREAVEIPSVSAWSENRSKITEMIDWAKANGKIPLHVQEPSGHLIRMMMVRVMIHFCPARRKLVLAAGASDPGMRPHGLQLRTRRQLEKLGASTELEDIGHQTLHDGSTIPLPPVLYGVLGSDPAKKTLCVYGHLDVQPAKLEDGWATEPFKPNNGKLFGRGTTDDKGPVIGWLNAIEAFQATNKPIPINIKFIFEGMEESGSLGLDEALFKRKDSWFTDVDYVCISDNYWLGKNKPCITYGLRGCCYFCVEIRCCKQDLHSGCFGGSVHEAMTDLVHVMGQLVDMNGKILIPGIYDNVEPLSNAELDLYKTIDFDPEDYRNDLGAKALLKPSKEDTLMDRWRNPCLSLHGIEGAFAEPGAKTVIPSKVVGKFSVRIVPNQTPQEVNEKVVAYVNQVFNKLGSPNSCVVLPEHGGRCWKSDVNHPNYQAGIRAVRSVFGVEPDLTREGASIPVTLTLQECTGKNCMLLPMGACDDMAHSQNEKLNISNYIQGSKLLAAYIHELGQI